MATRRVFLKYGLALGAAGFAPTTVCASVVSSNSGASARQCDPILRVLTAAEQAEQNTGVWAMTVAPDAVDRLQGLLQEAESREVRASSASFRQDLKQYLSYMNAAVTGALIVVGIAYGSAATIPVFLSSLTWSGASLVMQAMVAPGDVADTVVSTVPRERIGQVLSVSGNASYVANASIRTASRIGAGVLDVVNAYEAVQKAYDETVAAQEAEQTVNRARALVRTLRAELDLLTTHQQRNELRRLCAGAVAEEMRSVAGPSCLSPLP